MDEVRGSTSLFESLSRKFTVRIDRSDIFFLGERRNFLKILCMQDEFLNVRN